MESVLALQNSLVRMSQALLDVFSRSSRLDEIFDKMSSSLTTSISLISKIAQDEQAQMKLINDQQMPEPPKKSFLQRLVGGAMIDANEVLRNVEGTSGIARSLEEVKVALPYIEANFVLLKKACKEAQDMAQNAKNINKELTPIVQKSASLLNSDGIPMLKTSEKVLLTAFNSSMARLDANIKIVTDIAKDLMLDMGNAIEIFTQLQAYSAKAKERGLKSSVESSISLVLSNGASLGLLIKEINKILIVDAAYSKLIHPSVFSYQGKENPIEELKKLRH